MKCPCCGAPVADKKITDLLWSFKDFLNYLKNFTDEYASLKQYDLEYYFLKVKNKFPKLETWDMISNWMSTFILNDINSNGKFNVRYAKAEKRDDAATAYELIKENLNYFKSLNNTDPIELTAIAKSRFSDMTEWNNALFEHYIENALKFYIISIK